MAGVRAMGGPIGFDLGLGFPVYQSEAVKARGAVEGYAVYAKANLSF